MNEGVYDLVIAGGGLGGCAAAMSACERGMHVLMTEETGWIGGQVSSQGVPPDEHQWIEAFGATKRYRHYRSLVRRTYNQTMKTADGEELLNPGKGLVSSICHDPRVTHHVLNEMLLPYMLTGQLTILRDTQVVSVTREGRAIRQASIKNKLTGTVQDVSAAYFIDATETGELLPLAGLAYVTGAESKADTQEPHARDEADPNDIQAFTYVLGVEYREGEDHTIPKPDMYDFWKAFHPEIWPEPYLGLYAPHPITKERRKYTVFREKSGYPLWEYRRIFSKDQFRTSRAAGDVTLLNWPMNDYFLGNIYDCTDEERERHLYQAKQLSLSLLYWLQTEAPRPEGGRGYPGLKLRRDIFETEDGLAKYPYIRESRRIRAEYTITEQDVSPDFNSGKTGKKYKDRVGIGSYSIDLHPSMSGRSYIDIPALPYHIPMGALMPIDADNLLAGCKNIGTTHITNGCYRLHPAEWNIGEACGALAAFCMKYTVRPKEVRETDELLQKFQEELRLDGFELEWPDSFYE